MMHSQRCRVNGDDINVLGRTDLAESMMYNLRCRVTDAVKDGDGEFKLPSSGRGIQ